MLKNISDGLTAMIEGGTDTEHFGALYLTYLCQPADFHGADEHYGASAMWKALRTAIQTVEKIQSDRGRCRQLHEYLYQYVFLIVLLSIY